MWHYPKEERTSELHSLPASRVSMAQYNTTTVTKAKTSIIVDQARDLDQPPHPIAIRFSALAISIDGLADWIKLGLYVTLHIGQLPIQHSTNWASSGQAAFLNRTRLKLVLSSGAVLTTWWHASPGRLYPCHFLRHDTVNVKLR